MKLIDLLLLLAAVSLTAAGWTVTPALGLAALSVASGAGWWLLTDRPPKREPVDQ